MAVSDRLLDKMRSVKTLAERGSSGEREAAQEILVRLMKKYSISEADLLEEQTETFWFRYKDDLELKLLHQIFYMVMGDCPIYTRQGRNTNRKHKVFGVDCTAAQRLEIEIALEFYKRAMKEDLNTFYLAFIQKNNLFPPLELTSDKTEDQSLTDEELLKMQAMMAGMARRTLRKMIPGSRSEEKPYET
jgi:hypothetical protein